MMRLLLPALLLLAGATSAQAERLVVSLSNHGVQITSRAVSVCTSCLPSAKSFTSTR
jgi:hypothetical protein